MENVQNEIVPITGEAGTLLIFDTDVPHKAGGLKQGRKREALRIDSLSPSHSGLPTTIGGKIKRRVSGLLS